MTKQGITQERTHRNKFKNQVFVGCAIINTGIVLLLTTLCTGLCNTSLEQALSLPEFEPPHQTLNIKNSVIVLSGERLDQAA